MRDGDVFTGGGITTSVDLGLYFIESVMGKETAKQIAKYLDYPYFFSFLMFSIFSMQAFNSFSSFAFALPALTML